MPEFIDVNGHIQSLVHLRVKPHSHRSMPTITGNAFSRQAGAVLYGHYNMEYLLPQGDRLRLIANHNKKTVQLMLFTQDSKLIQSLPGERCSSLVADTISRIERYCVRARSYVQPLTKEQKAKVTLANHSIQQLKELLEKERLLSAHDHEGREALRAKVLSIIERCRDNNRLLANNPVISEGSFGRILYDAHKAAHHFEFNRVYAVSTQDQMDFKSTNHDSTTNAPPCFVWDSELHIGHNSDDLDDAIRVICNHYDLLPAEELSNTPANRFKKLEVFFQYLWRDGRDWINYLATSIQPTHKTDTSTRTDGVSITTIAPYYRLSGFEQKGYNSVKDMMLAQTGIAILPLHALNLEDAQKLLNDTHDDNWVYIGKKATVLYKQHGKLIELRYFKKDKSFYPLPIGDDLYTLSQISKRHLYLPERVRLRLFAFVSRIPSFFKNFYTSMRKFIVQDLHQEFMTHVHKNHQQSQNDDKPNVAPPGNVSTLHKVLQQNGRLSNGQTLEEFILEHIENNPYVIARANHPPSPPAYENPFHRLLGVVRHLAGFFVDVNERNPIIGTLATAAYFYGAGAVLAPNALENILVKLHLSGLIAGIEPTQKMAHAMSHGQLSEGVTAAVTYWQGIVIGGNLDQFFVDAVTVLKDDPAEVAIIVALALSLGYGLTKAIPSLEDEMGSFPIPNYLALGAKGGAAIYDTIMHPGDDWLLGTFKWMAKFVVTLGKIWVAPFIEGYYYGYNAGFKNGVRKSIQLVKALTKQFVAASCDFMLYASTIPLLETTSLLIHVPFRGITNLIAKLLATVGNLSALSESILYFAKEQSNKEYTDDFMLSPLYGFPQLAGRFSDNWTTNILINMRNIAVYLPLHLVKNLVLLPLTDGISMVSRMCLTAINLVMYTSAFCVGKILHYSGTIWDPTFGLIFSGCANGFTKICNLIDQRAGERRQKLLGKIEILRGELFAWGFGKEDKQLHHTLVDKEYYKNDPTRLEKIPHSSSHCLLQTLLNKPSAEVATVSRETESKPIIYAELFKSPHLHAVNEESLYNNNI